MAERVFDRASKLGEDREVDITTAIYDRHLSEVGKKPEVQVSISACVNGVQPSFTFYMLDEAQLFELAEQFKAAGVALAYAKKYAAK